MEDIPRETGLKIVSKGKEIGLSAVAVVDAHNSIKGYELSLSNEDVKNLQKAAERALLLASKEPREKFEIGTAKVIPKDLDLVIKILKLKIRTVLKKNQFPQILVKEIK